MIADNGNAVTGTRDVVYDLISVIYHALKGAETYSSYIEDADFMGDQELVQFFRRVQEEDRRRAEEAKRLLRKHLAREAAEDWNPVEAHVKGISLDVV